MKLYANPHNSHVSGFYFETYDEFEENAKELKKEYEIPIEDLSIEIVDGSRAEIELIETLQVNPNNLESILDVIENVSDYYWPKLFFLLDNNITSSLKDAKNKMEDVNLYNGCLSEIATQIFNDYFEDLGNIPPEIRNYIDYEKFTNDLEREGSVLEFDFAGDTYTCVNVNDL